MTDAEFMRGVLQRIATGPTLSKDIAEEEAFQAMRLLLEGRADEVQAGIFLIALRMKRETDEELAGILRAIQAGIEPVAVDVDQLVTIVDPYDGFLRGLPMGPFLPSVLAACGLPCLSHGVESMGPKFGASHLQVLREAGVPIADTRHQTGLTRHAAAEQLAHPDCGWALLSQQELAPELAALTGLRTRIVKRPCLTTIEVAVQSLIPKGQSHLVTGFVHKPYPPIYARLASRAGFGSSILVRGVEGGVVPSLSQASRYHTSEDGDTLQQVDIEPSQLAISQQERCVPLPAHLTDDSVRSVKEPGNAFAQQVAIEAARAGLAALSGESGPARDSLVYAAAIILQARGIANGLSAAADLAREAIDSGDAERRFRSARL